MNKDMIKTTCKSIRRRVAIILAATMILSDCMPVAGYAMDSDVLLSGDTQSAADDLMTVAEDTDTPVQDLPAGGSIAEQTDITDGEALIVDRSEDSLLSDGEVLSDETADREDSVLEADEDDSMLLVEDEAEAAEVLENPSGEAESVTNEAIAGQYDFNADLLKASENRTYPGVYSVKVVSGNNGTIGIPSISNERLKDGPTIESPAIIMGAAVPYEKKVGPTDYDVIPGGKLYAPYSYFRYEIIEEANLNGQGGTHKKMSGFDGTYVIIRVDVSDIIKDVPDGSYLHVKQTNNKALMVKIGEEFTDGSATFSDACGNKTGAYLVSGNKLVTRDADGGYRDASFIDVIFLSSGTLVQGADTGSTTPDPKAPLADFPLSFYVDDTGDYDPGIEWNSSLGTAVDKATGKAITLTPAETEAGITTSDKILAKYYDEEKAKATVSSNYTVKGSDIELEMMVEENTASGKTEYWSLKKGMEYPGYNSHALKLICEAPLLNSLSVRGDGPDSRHVILDVNSFDIQLANHNETGAAALTVDNATLTIQDTFNTTGAELAVGNNAQMLITNNGRFIIEDSAQLEVEYDAASVSAGSVPEKKLNNGVITVNNGGIIVNKGIITVEGREGKPQNPADAQAVVRDYSNARLTIDEGGTLENMGCVLVNGDLYNFGTIKNSGLYADTITSNDPDKGTFTYHKGIQLSWKDDITQGETFSGELFNGVYYDEEGSPITYPGASLINSGDIVLIPGYLDNYATITNSGNIYMCAVDEIVIPITAYADKPLVTEKRINLGRFEDSYFINQQGSTLNNSGTIGTAEIEIVSNGRTGDIKSYENRDKKNLNIRSDGKTVNSGKIAVNALYSSNDVTNDGADGVIERLILTAFGGNSGSFVNNSKSQNTKVYNGAKVNRNTWVYSELNALKVSEDTRIQQAEPGDKVNWTLNVGSDHTGEAVLYSVELTEESPYRVIGVYDVWEDQDTVVESENLPDLKGNVVYRFEADSASLDYDARTDHAVVKVNGKGLIKPTAIKDLVYNGKQQSLVTPGSLEGDTVLYKLEGGAYSENIPTAVNAGEYTVYYRTQNNGENDPDFSGTINVSISKRDVFVAADNMVISKGGEQKDPTYVSNGIVSGDNIGIALTCPGLDPSVPGNKDIIVNYDKSAVANYNVTTYDGTYTVLDTDVEISANVQAVLTPFDNVGHNVSINLVYQPEVTTNKATMYYSLSENLTPDNYASKGTSVAPAYGSIGYQEIHYYVHTPEGADFYGSRPVVVTKAEQTAPDKLKGEGNMEGKGGTITGLDPFNTEYIPMEYRRADESEYTRVVYDYTELRAGDYLVRYGADEHYRPSADTLVKVSENGTASVTFDSKGGSPVEPVVGLKYGDTVPRPEDPVKEGSKFVGWYWLDEDVEGEEFEYDFSTIIEEVFELTLYAKWKTVIPDTSEEDAEDLNKDTKNGSLSVNKSKDEKEQTETTTVTVSGTNIDKTISEVTKSSENKITVKSGIWIGGLEESYTYTGSAIKPVIHVYDGVKKLIEKEDYTLNYKNNKNALSSNEVNAPTITVKFKGNYQGTAAQKVYFTIAPAELGTDIDLLDTSVVAKRNNASQKPVAPIMWKSTGKAVSSRFFEYTYYDKEGKEVEGVTAAGNYTVKAAAKDSNYKGSLSANLVVVDDNSRMLSKASVKFNPSSYVYTGKEIIPDYRTITVKIGQTELNAGSDYVIETVYNNVEPGKATMVLKAKYGNDKGLYGTKTAMFAINKGRVLDKGSSFIYTYPKTVPFLKSGAKPVLKVFDGTKLLEEGVDYAVSFKNNKSVLSASAVNPKGKSIAPTMIIKGKGNYKGSVEFTYGIDPQEMESLDAVADDQFVKAAVLKDKSQYENIKPKVTVTDLDGKKLVVNKDYSLGNAEYEIINENIIQVFVPVEGKGNYTGETNVSFMLMNSADTKCNIAKAGANKIAEQAYTGREVTLDSKDFDKILYTGKKSEGNYLTLGKDFEITGYTDNIKKGTAKVTVRGINGMAGTKTLTFKITQKKGSFIGVLLNGKWVQTPEQ